MIEGSKILYIYGASGHGKVVCKRGESEKRSRLRL